MEKKLKYLVIGAGEPEDLLEAILREQEKM